MSAYGHEMERELSAHSLPSREGSEMGSRYATDAGIFMSSTTAMVLISGLVTLGVSLVSLLVALTVMLQSCESRHSGVVEMYRHNKYSYIYCRDFALHAELNGLGTDSLPATCKDVDRLYVKEGHYKRDLNVTVGMVEDYFSSFTPKYDGGEIVMMDVDDLAYELIYRVNEGLLHDSSRDGDYLKHIFVKKLYLKLLRSGGSQLTLFSRKPDKLRNAMVEYLTSLGCHGWSSLIMRKETEMQVDFQEFLSRQRIIMQRDGSRIIAVISSQMDALRGPCLGDRIFKLPSPMFSYSTEDHAESEIQESKEM
ncbi:uncharacterized protein at2g39920 [Phtheirospermum japonicum]|uniref:Uncharacterized protein at2g39920 n=1 Tax=Phtheirospermum japonicum TaxID=374723 RepID=A0A830BLH4_9LAMI|nr:uncharacterized protein at2g39920 [Phtheirospermum japonicum]